MAGKCQRPVDRTEARRLLADGVTACTHCRPDTDLGIDGLGSHLEAPRQQQSTASDRLHEPELMTFSDLSRPRAYADLLDHWEEAMVYACLPAMGWWEGGHHLCG